MATSRSLLDTLISDKQASLAVNSASKRLNLGAKESPTEPEWETISAANAGLKLWAEPNGYGVSPRLGDDELRARNLQLAQEGQPNPDDPMVQVRRDPNSSNTLGYSAIRNLYTGQDLTATTFNPGNTTSLEEDAFNSKEQLRAAYARDAGEDFVPQKYDPSGEKPYNSLDYTKNPGDQQYTPNKRTAWANEYSNQDPVETLYTGEQRPRFDKQRGNLQQEHITPMASQRKVDNDAAGTNLSREEFQQTSARANRIEGDPRLFSPVTAGMNKFRGTMPYGEVGGDSYFDANKQVKVDTKKQIIEPRDAVKGQVARQQLTSRDEYGIPIPNEATIEKWNKKYRPTEEERLKSYIEEVNYPSYGRNQYIPPLNEEELLAAVQNPDNKYAKAGRMAIRKEANRAEIAAYEAKQESETVSGTIKNIGASFLGSVAGIGGSFAKFFPNNNVTTTIGTMSQEDRGTYTSILTKGKQKTNIQNQIAEPGSDVASLAKELEATELTPEEEAWMADPENKAKFDSLDQSYKTIKAINEVVGYADVTDKTEQAQAFAEYGAEHWDKAAKSFTDSQAKWAEGDKAGAAADMADVAGTLLSGAKDVAVDHPRVVAQMAAASIPHMYMLARGMLTPKTAAFTLAWASDAITEGLTAFSENNDGRAPTDAEVAEIIAWGISIPLSEKLGVKGILGPTRDVNKIAGKLSKAERAAAKLGKKSNRPAVGPAQNTAINAKANSADAAVDKLREQLGGATKKIRDAKTKKALDKREKIIDKRKKFNETSPGPARRAAFEAGLLARRGISQAGRVPAGRIATGTATEALTEGYQSGVEEHIKTLDPAKTAKKGKEIAYGATMGGLIGAGFTTPTAVAQVMDKYDFSNQLKKAVNDAYKRPVKDLGAFRKTMRNSRSTFADKINPNMPETYDPQAAHLEEKNRYEQLVAAPEPDQQEILKTVKQFFLANEAALSEAVAAYDVAKEADMSQDILDGIEKEIKKLTDDASAVATHYTAFVNKAATAGTSDTPVADAPETEAPAKMSTEEAQETLAGLKTAESSADPQAKTSSLVGALQALNDADEAAALNSSPKDIEKANAAFYTTLEEAEKLVTSKRDKAIIAAFKAVAKGRSTKSRFKVREEVLGAGRNSQGNLGGLGYINKILADPSPATAKSTAKLFEIFLGKQKAKQAALQEGIDRVNADPNMGELEIQLGSRPFTIGAKDAGENAFKFKDAESMLTALKEENLILEEMVNAANDYVATLSNQNPPAGVATSTRPAPKKTTKKKATKKKTSKKKAAKKDTDPFKDIKESAQSAFDTKTQGKLGDTFNAHMDPKSKGNSDARLQSIQLAHSLNEVGDAAALRKLLLNYTEGQLRTIAQILFPYADTNARNRGQVIGVIIQYKDRILEAEKEQNKKDNIPQDPDVEEASVEVDDNDSDAATGILVNVSYSEGAADFPTSDADEITDTDADARALPEEEVEEEASALQKEANNLYAILGTIKSIPKDEVAERRAKIQGHIDANRTIQARKEIVKAFKRIEKDGTFSRKGRIGSLKTPISNVALHTTFRTLANAEYIDKEALDARQKLLNDAIEVIEKGEASQEQINEALVDKAFDFYKKYGWPAALNIMTVNSFKGEQQNTVASRDFQSSRRVKNLLSQVPDLLSTIRLPQMWAKVQGLRNMVGNEMYHVQHTLGDFHDAFAAEYYKQYGTDIEALGSERSSWNKSPLLAFKDVVRTTPGTSGTIPENMMVAMAWGAYSLLASRMQGTLLTTPSEIKNIFGMQDHEQLTDSGATVLSSAGIPVAALYRMFGKTALDLVGLEGKTNAKLPRIQALQTDMGMVMLQILSNMNLVDLTFIERAAITKFTGGAKINLDTTVDKGAWFGRIGTVEGNLFETTQAVKEIVAKYHEGNGTKDALKNLLDLNTDEDTPELEPIEKVGNRVKRTLMNVTERAKQAFKKSQASAWTSDTQIADFVTQPHIENSTLLARLVGIKEGENADDMSAIPLTQRDSQKARNQGLRRELGLFATHREGVGKAPWYLRIVTWVNGRSGPKSIINPQTYKHTHRALASKDAWKRKLTFSADFHMPALQGGIMAAFGQTSDKGFLPHIIAAFESKVMYMEDSGNNKRGQLRPGPIKEVVALYEKAEKEALTEEETDRFMYIVDEYLGGEGLEAVNGLIALRDMSKALIAGKESMTVDLHTEIDAVTNGVINAVLQLGIDPDRAAEILAAGGVYTNAKNGAFEFGQPHRNKAKRDNYEELAYRISQLLEAERKLIGPNDGPGLAKFNALSALGPDFFTKKRTSGISSKGRDFTKYPLMLIVYGASLRSIKKAQAEETLDSIYSQLGDIQTKKNAAATPQAKAKLILGEQTTLIKNILTVIGEDVMFGVEGGNAAVNSLTHFMKSDFDLNNIRFSPEVEDQLKIAINAHFGAATEKALNDFFGDLIKHRDVANTFFNIQQKVYLLFWNKEKDAILEKYQTTFLTTPLENELKRNLRERGIVPGIAGPLSDPNLTGKDAFSDHVQTTKYDMLEGGSRSAEVIKQNKKQTSHRLIKLNDQGWVQDIPNGHTMGKSIMSRIPIISPKENLGALGYVMVNQNLDGTNVIEVTNEHPDVNSVFDAFLMSILEANAVSQTADAKMWEVAKNYNLFKEIDIRLQHLQDVLAEEAKQAAKDGVPSIDSKLSGLMANTNKSARGNKSMKIENFFEVNNHAYFSSMADFVKAFRGADGVSGISAKIQTNWEVLRNPNDGIKRFNNFPFGQGNSHIVKNTTTNIPKESVVEKKHAQPKSADTDVTPEVNDASNTEVNRPFEPHYARNGDTLEVEGQPHAKVSVRKQGIAIVHIASGKTFIKAATEENALTQYNNLLASTTLKGLNHAIESNDALGASPGAANNLEWFVPDYDKDLTVFNMVQIFNRLGQEWYNQKDSKEHADYLKGMLNELMVPILTKLDDPDITIHIGTAAKKSQGQATANHVYVAGSKDTLLTEIYMSPQEVMMHELVHTFLKNALTEQAMQDEAFRLFRLAKKVVTVEDFLRRDSNGDVIVGQSYQQEMDSAKRRYNYVFNNKANVVSLTHGTMSLTGLNEFVSFGLTNEAFKNRLLGIDQNPEYKKVLGDGLIPALWALFNNAISFFHRILNRKKGKNAHSALVDLAKDAHGIQKKQQYKLDKWVGKIKPLDNVVSKGIDYAFRNVYAPYVKSRRGKVNSNLARRTMDTVIAMPYDVTVGAFREGVHRMMYNYKFNRDNALYSMLNEIDPTGEGKIPTRYNTLALKAASEQSNRREATALDVSSDIRARFDNERMPGDAGFISLEAAYLKINAGKLRAEYSLHQITNMFVDKPKLKAEIDRWEKKLAVASRDSFNYQSGQLQNLGRNMATGIQGIPAPMKNAFIIGNNLLTGVAMGSNTDAEAAVAAGDILASLWAIHYTDETHLEAAARIASHEASRAPEGEDAISYMVTMADSAEQQAFEKSFKGNRIHMAQGYTADIYSEYVDVKLGLLTDEVKFNDMNYTRMPDTFVLDPNSSFRKKKYFYASNTSEVGQSVNGGLSKKDQRARGFGTDGLYSTDTGRPANMGSSVVRNAVAEQTRLNNLAVKKQFRRRMQPDLTQNYMTPVVSITAKKIVDYTYNLTEQQKVQLYRKKNTAPDVLGKMHGSMIDSLATDKYNREFVDLLKETYDNDKSAFKSEFIFIGPTADKEEYRNMWSVLPRKTKEYIREVFDTEGFYIHDSVLRITMGFQKGSLVDWANSIVPIPRPIRQTLKHAGNIWEEIVSRQKRYTVQLTPQVVISNIINNQTLSMLYDVPPVYMLEQETKAIGLIRTYLEDITLMDRLKRENYVEKNLSKKRKVMREIDVLQKRLESNDLHYLFDKGAFQNLAEDFKTEEGGLAKALKNALPIFDEMSKTVRSGAPKGVEKFYDEYVMSPNTDASKVMAHAVQYSDFVSRYAMFKYKTEEEGMSKSDAFDLVMKVFIDYETPSSVQMDWLNRNGILQYTKFMFRFQRVLAEVAKNAPGRLMALELIDQMGLHIPSPLDSMLTANSFISHGSLPFSGEILDKAFLEDNLFNQLQYVFNPFGLIADS